MNVLIRTRNYNASEKVRQYAEKRLKKLDKLLDKEVEAVVTFVGGKNKQRIEITIPVNGFILRGEDEHEDIMTAIDSVTDKLDKQLVRSKERFSKKGRLSVTKLPTLSGVTPATEDDEELKVRIKQFSAKPMNIEEAITRMDMIGHAFFAFNNEESGVINVVYRRNDGHYGLLEPEA
jgi:putative sigma-54 modulation protein